jgi:hypothetical protein
MGPIGCTETSNVPQQQQVLRMVNKCVFDLIQLLSALLRTVEFCSSLFTAIIISHFDTNVYMLRHKLRAKFTAPHKMKTQKSKPSIKLDAIRGLSLFKPLLRDKHRHLYSENGKRKSNPHYKPGQALKVTGG